MDWHRTYRFRLEPNGNQRRLFAQFAGACRWVWNQALVEQKRRLKDGEGWASYAEMCRWITAWRHDPATRWLADIHVHPLQQRLKDQAKAVGDFCREAGNRAKKGPPRFKKKGLGDTFRYPMGLKVEPTSPGWGRIWLPKIGWVRYRASRVIEGAIAQATVIREGENWFIAIQAKREVEEPARSELPAVGLDLGVVRFATLSDGTVFDPLNAFGRHRSRVARCQRALARKQRGSKNFFKQCRRLNALRLREARARRDFQHKLSTTLAMRYGTVVMEDLAVGRMTSSARGTLEAPAKGVRAKAGLNRSILDQGWYQFRMLLEYKLAERGASLILVNPSFTSQRCSACGHTEAANRESQAVFRCRDCGYSENADLNASRNILVAAGQAVKACGGIGCEPPVEAGTRRESDVFRSDR